MDACTGKTLLDTLVNPGDVEVSDGAKAVHGITDGELAESAAASPAIFSSCEAGWCEGGWC